MFIFIIFSDIMKIGFLETGIHFFFIFSNLKMPYVITKLKNGYYTVKKKSGAVKARHTTLAKAKAQVRLLHMLERMR